MALPPYYTGLKGKILEDMASDLQPYLDDAASSAASAASNADATASDVIAAENARDATLLAASASNVYETHADAVADLANIGANEFAIILLDENYADQRSYYQKQGASLVFIRLLRENDSVTWWVDPVAGSDSGDGTIANPFATFSKAVSVSVEGDAIRGKPQAEDTCWVKEDFNASALDNCSFDASGYVFQAYDTTAITWTYVSGNIWKGTVNHLFGGVGVLDTAAANKVYTGLFGGGTAYRDKTSGAALANEAAAVAALTDAGQYSLLGPLVGGVQSCRANGWTQGNHTYYVRTDGTDPSTLTWQVQQRTQPTFGKGWTLGSFGVFGGRGHNGVEMMGATVIGRVEIWYASCHGVFCCGVQGPGKIVFRSRNPNGSAGYAFHTFNGGDRMRATILNSPEVYGYNESLDTVFGGHGSNQGNDITEAWIINDAYLVNVRNIGGNGANAAGATYGPITNGIVFNRLRAYGANGTAWFDNITVNEPIIVHNGTDSGSTCLSAPDAGRTVSIKGGSISGGTRGQFTTGSGTGTINLTDVDIIIGTEQTNNRWWAATAGTWNFTRCLIEADGGSEAIAAMGTVNGSTVTLTDCNATGMAWPTATTRTRTRRGGKIGLQKGPHGEVISSGALHARSTLGEKVLGMAWSINDNTTGVNVTTTEPWLFTDAGVRKFGPTGTTVGAAGAAWTGASTYLPLINGVVEIGKNFVVGKIIAYGQSGTLIYWNHSATITTAPTVVDLSGIGYNTKNITCAVPGPHNGKVLFGCSDGSVFEYDFSTATATARTSGITFGLTGGVWNGTTVIMCGSDASGSTLGTAGGAIVSTDSGATWGNSLVSGDASAADTADWEKRVKCAAYVNGTYLLFGARGCMLSSVDGSSSSWAIRNLGIDWDVHTVAVDATKNQVMIGGYSGLGPDYRGGGVAFIDASRRTGVELYGSTTYDPASLADGAGVTTTITVTGAAVGDFVEVSSSVALQGITFTGWVSATNTVSVRYQNETGGTIDLASGTIAAVVRPRATDPAVYWKAVPVECPVLQAGPRILFARGATYGPTTVNLWVVSDVLGQVLVSENPQGGWRRISAIPPARTFDSVLTKEQALMLSGA